MYRIVLKRNLMSTLYNSWLYFETMVYLHEMYKIKETGALRLSLR